MARSAERDSAAESRATAQQKADAIIIVAKEQASAVLSAADAAAASIDQAYSDAWQSARAAGWTPAQLRSLGYIQLQQG